MTSNYSFPLLTRKEIVKVLAESEVINIREEDLKDLTPDLVSSLYENLLSYLDPFQDDHGQADFSALGQLENPDLHIDSIRTMNLFQKIKEMMVLVNCHTNFTLKDLIKPDAHRTLVFLSAILNFCLHRETRLNFIHPFVDQVGSHEEKRLELEERISQLNMEISNLKDVRESEQPFVQEVDAKVKELRQTIQGLNNEQMSLKASFRALRDKTKELDEKITNADFILAQSAQENVTLRSKIVQSPDKLQGALEEKKVVRDEMKNSKSSALQSFQEKTATLEVYTKASKKMTKHLAQMQAILEQVSSAKNTDKDVKVLKAKLSDERVLDKSLEAKLVEQQRKVEQMEEARKAFKKERDLRQEEATKELNRLKLEVESKKSSMASREKKVEAMVAEADNISLKIYSVRESGAFTQQELHRKCIEIVNEFHNYSHTIGDFMQRFETGLEEVA